MAYNVGAPKDQPDLVKLRTLLDEFANLGLLGLALVLGVAVDDPNLRVGLRGIRNILVLRGDDPAAGDQPDAKPVFDLDSGALITTAVGIRERGELPSGRRGARSLSLTHT